MTSNKKDEGQEGMISRREEPRTLEDPESRRSSRRSDREGREEREERERERDKVWKNEIGLRRIWRLWQ